MTKYTAKLERRDLPCPVLFADAGRAVSWNMATAVSPETGSCRCEVIFSETALPALADSTAQHSSKQFA